MITSIHFYNQILAAWFDVNTTLVQSSTRAYRNTTYKFKYLLNSITAKQLAAKSNAMQAGLCMRHKAHTTQS